MAHSGRQEPSQPPPPTGPYEENEGRQEQQGMSPQTNYDLSQQYPQQQYPPQTRADSFNMNQMGTALPNPSYHNYGQVSPQRYTSGTGLNYQLSQVPQYAGGQPTGNSLYNVPYQGQFQGIYPQGNSPSPTNQQPGASVAGNQFYHNQGFTGQQQQGSQYFMQPSQFNPQSQMYAAGPSAGPYGSRNSFAGENRYQTQQQTNEYLGVNYSGGGIVRSSGINSGASQSSIVRGPPRKPRQSGHAIWIGNLPPQTELMSLVHHVCKEAPGLESLFLISKSNCAFANFKDEDSCSAAQAKIHDSRFQTVRLVSRLRRSSAGTATGIVVPIGPAALSPPNPPLARSPSPETSERLNRVEDEAAQAKEIDGEDNEQSQDKFFVVKSLTVEDLELSARNGIWATQSHNEESLNKAFKANKSGQYFGYARMTSQINNDPAAAIEFAPKAQAVEDPELPKAISTEATEFAPKGRIIDDSARGTIFWEAEREEEEEDDSDSNKSDQGETTPSKAWGKPFKIEWVSTTPLPFYRTRGLRNPWNSNREVKIARDGTELETSIGRRLIALFHRVPSPPQPLIPLHGLAVPLMGYPPMRPFS